MQKGKPEVVFVAITAPDGSLAVMQFVTLVRRNEEDDGYRREASPENIVAEIAKAGVPCQSWRIVDPAGLPADRTYRNAWADDGTVIGHDMAKARAIHMDRIRAARAPRLEDLDAQWMRATGQGRPAETAQIEAQRQKLRDLPQTLDLSKAATVEALKALWPPELP